MPIGLISTLLFSLLALQSLAQNAYAQQDSGRSSTSKEIGNFYHKNYSPKVYNAAFQNWGGLQDKHGIMFFSNTDGVLTYDGKTWSLIQTPSQGVVRSMALNEDGKIYVGALDDIGYLDRLKNGAFTYVSLLDKVRPELHSMGNIWQIYAHQDLVYFESETGLFCWNGERFEFWPWPNPDAYHLFFLWKGTAFVQEEGIGLMTLKDGKFSLAPNGEFFKDIRIYKALPLKNRIQLATQYDGLYFYDGSNVKRFYTQADSFFKANQIYCGLILPDSAYVYGTRMGGATILDQEGRIQYLINNQTGLPTNIALGVTLDQEGNLWFSLDNGISKFEINSPLSFYDTRHGLEGSVNRICRYNGKLYVATNTGLYFLQPSSFSEHPAHFKKVSAINRTCWDLLPMEDRLLISSNQGLFELIRDELRTVTEFPSFDLHRYKADTNRIIVSSNNQLQSLKLIDGQWQGAGSIKDIALDNITFAENTPGKVWMSTYSQGAALLSFAEENGDIDYDDYTIKFFDQKNGLPEGGIAINHIGGEEIFNIGSQPRYFRFDYSRDQFTEDVTLPKKIGFPSDGLIPVSDDDRHGNFFVRTDPKSNTKQELIFVKRTSKISYELKSFDISRISEQVHITTFLEGNMMWMGGPDGIVRYEMEESPNVPLPFNTFIHKIILLGDSVFFSGIGNLEQNLTFPYSSNSLRFEFTANNFAAEEKNEFQYKLEGFDDEWAEWTTENIKEYPRLVEGNYKFLVRSRNYAKQIGLTDEFGFSVAPPWYRSFYAYIVYIMGAAVFVWGLVRWRLQSVLQEKAALQAEIDYQTQEIRQQNIQLAEQSEELVANAEQLKALDKMKSNFFVNISHEFRTPLSLIIGPLEEYIQENDSGQIRLTDLERMHRNAKRLQQLINQLLDLAKLESGGMKLNPKHSDFIYFLRVLAASFESLAERRNIQFEVNTEVDTFESTFDHEKIETVVNNLLSNAFKFTPDGGRISVDVTFSHENSNQLIEITIADSGPGIPANEAEKIFDRFYQVDSSSAREFEGSGIGLSLVKELVQFMQGTIGVQSTVGEGTKFIVQLPLKLEAAFDSSLLLQKEAGESVSSARPPVHKTRETKVLTENSDSSVASLVLLVEDNADLRSYLKENLEADYAIAVAENGLLGFEKAVELTPDLILSDMMMPVMDGFTLCTKIREDERTSHIPFILLTARTTIESKLEGLELGADEYMTKPFNIKEVKVRIKNLLDQRKNLRKSFSREVTIQPKNISITSVDEKFLNHALEILETNLSDQQFSVERFAEEMGMSRKNLLRKIKALTDQSVNEFIRNFRLHRAAQLISGKTATISEIAYRVGFNNLSYFSKCFKELFGVLPTEYLVSGSTSTVEDSQSREL